MLFIYPSLPLFPPVALYQTPIITAEDPYVFPERSILEDQKKKKASEQRPDPDADYADDEEEYVIPEDDEPEPVEDESDYDAEPEGSKE